MKRVLLGVVILFSVLKVCAQQDAQWSQNMFITAPINPGAVGIKGMHCFDLLGRNQWIGFTGAPKTTLLSYNGPVSNNFGLGGVLEYEDIANHTETSFKINGAFHFNVGSEGGKLGVGLDLGILQQAYSTDPDSWTAVDPNDNVFASLGSDMGFDIGFGIFYYKREKLYFGVSGQKLLPQKLTFGEAQPKIRQHAYITTGYYHDAGNGVVLKPSMLVKTDLTSHQVDVNLTAEFNKRIWLGGSYRIQDAIVANVGFRTKPTNNLQPIKIGFAYDFTTNGLRDRGTFIPADSQQEPNDNNRSLGGVELYIGYCIVPPPRPDFDIYVDPLFL